MVRSDQGRKFGNVVQSEFFELTGTKHCGYNRPQSNGLTESGFADSVVDKTQNNWDDHLSAIDTLCIPNTQQKATKIFL